MSWIYIAIAILIIGFFLWLLFQPKQGQKSSNRPLETSYQLPKHSESQLSDLREQVHALLEKNKRIEAIKVVRQTHGWGLKRAKEYVDSIANVAPNPSQADGQSELIPTVKALIAQDQLIEAIKYVRQQTGMGLKDTKEYVDQIRRNQ